MRNDLPNLNVLIAFEAAGQLLSFKQAAEQLFLTPSAISQQIQRLETALGIQLFERGNRSLALTPAGQDYWNKVSRHLNGLRRATTELQQQRGQQRLRVSVMPPVANRVLFPRLHDFQARHPDIELHIETALANTDLNAGVADLAIRFGVPPWNGLLHEKLCDVQIQVVCPPGFTEQYGLAADFRRIREVPVIHMSGRPHAWERWFSQTGLGEPCGRQYHVDDYPAAIQAAESLGAALALYPIETPLITEGRLEAPFPPAGPLDEAIYAVYPQRWQYSPSAQAFIQWLREQLATMGQTSPQSD